MEFVEMGQHDTRYESMTVNPPTKAIESKLRCTFCFSMVIVHGVLVMLNAFAQSVQPLKII